MSPALEFPIPDPTSDLHWGEYRGAIHEIFAANARSFPDRPCVEVTRTGGPSLTFTYRQIHAASNRLANYLLARGCELGDVVSIYAYRGVDLVVAYMGALKAGATVSVLDPQYPPERQKVLLDVARPRFLVCIRRANEESGPPSAAVMEFIAINLSMKSVIPALELRRDGELRGGGAGSEVDGADCLASASEDDISSDRVAVGPDSNPTLSFTSGSEGRPKGVLGRHFSLTYYTPWMAGRFGLSAADRFTMLSGIAHDPIQRDIFTPLFLGARIVIPPGDVITYELLAEWMREHSVTVTHLTPAMGQILVGGAATQFPALRLAFFVGDLLTKKDCRKLRDLAPAAAVINLYGSTESQRAVSYFPVPSRDQDPDFLDRLEPDVIPIGQGMLDVQLLVVSRDDRSRLCGVAEQGELFLRAGGLAEGYLERDEAAAELNRSKFLPSWFVDSAKWKEQQPQKRQPGRDGTWKGPRDRVYRTGDLGRMRADGSIECTGRIDLQVKIRGFRIELGEIDVHLSQHPFVRENVTVVRRDKNEEQTLVTYFVPETKRWFEHLEAEERHPRREGREEVETADESMIGMLRRFKTLSEHCRRFLAAKVPTYAVPSIFIPLSRMPLNPNGKVERTALPFPDEADFAALSKRRASSVTPAAMTETQARLAVVWASLLPGRASRTFRPESNFFDEGGHSILAQQLFFRLRREWDLDLPVSAIFQSQTLAALAAEIDRARDPIGLRLDAMPLPGDASVEDEAYAADARDLARHLPASLRSADAAAGRVTGSGSGSPGGPVVFLTGATGFLGSYILRELLDGPAAATRVVAHVRAADADAALARITGTATAYGLWSPAWASRVQAVAGDLARPRLGLSEETWARLAEEVDVVVHNGAHVNWMLPYSSLRPVNVLSTMACIELCAAGARPKRLALVSSTSVLDSAHYVMLSRTGGVVSEDDDLEGSRKGLATGYGQTKWASEFVVREAGRRGLSGAIIRPGYVSGDPESGICVTDDFLVRLWKGSLQVAGRPDMDHGVNVVPVTQVSRIVAAAALHLCPSRGGPGVVVAQITGHPRLTFNKWIGALETYGYAVPAIPYPEWRERISAYVTRWGDGDGHGDGAGTAQEEKEEHALLPLFHLVAGDLPADTVAPELDDTNAAAALRLYMGDTASSPLAGSAVSEDTLGCYFANLVASGFLPAPPRGGGGRGVRELPRLGQEARALAAGRLGGRSAGR